jgi:hypothetical protein
LAHTVWAAIKWNYFTFFEKSNGSFVSFLQPMKTVFLFICVAFLFSSCGEEDRKVTADLINFPQTASGEQVELDVPVIDFDSTVFNFGTISIGEKVVHSFRFTNTGKAPLVISQVVPSCGCTTLKDWPKDPILPGETGTITAEFNSSGFPGLISKTISVGTNCIPKDWYLKLEGEVKGTEAEQKIEAPIKMERIR